MTGRSDLQFVLDRLAIQDVLVRYFRAIDRGDRSEVRSCFTADVRAAYSGRAPALGIDALLGSLEPFFHSLERGETKISTHFMGNLHLERIEGDDAETETNAIAFHVRPGTSGDRVAVRSLRYLDRLRRTAGGWRICERSHTLDWASEEAATSAVTLAQRLMHRPHA